MRLEILVALLAAPTGPVAAPPTKPWVLHAEVPCDWWLSGPNGKEHHASIGQGDDDPVLSVSERSFFSFSERDQVPLVLRFNGDRRREAAATAWVSSVVGDGERMLGMYLRAPARKAMGGATRIEIVHRGNVLADIALAATPSQAVLDACVVPPNPDRDDESGG